MRTALVVLTLAAVPVVPASVASAGDTTTNLACATQIVEGWPLTRQADETIVVSVKATNVGAMVPAARAGFGGLLLFGTTAPANFAVLLARVQARSAQMYPMLVMTDEEGGGVRRLTNLVRTFPWAQTMGENLSPSRITAIAERVGASLLASGVNVDLAPVLDVDGRAVDPSASDPDGLRSFGGSPSLVAADGAAFLRGLTLSHVVSVVKHFPGLGGASRNTDDGPATTKPWPVLQRTALEPFERAIADGVPAVMLSNASVPGLTSLPSSISPAVVEELRQTLGFTGLIVTDALSAGAISAIHLSEPAAMVKALQAGADLLLNGSPGSAASSFALAEKDANAIVKAVNDGTLPSSTLVAAAAQVLATRNVLACPTATTTTSTTTTTTTTTTLAA
jgi:beta-N-acetylhexosaminidase